MLMENIIIVVCLILILVLIKLIFKINIKEIKNLGENQKLDNEINKYPENIEICKKILKKLGNESVKIEENKDASNCLYLVATNKILIGDLKGSFTRIQTIAHECLHSIQDKRILMFNFIYSNIYLITFLVLGILSIFQILPYKMLFLSLYIIMGLIFYFVRSYLENDAMIKARFLAKEYMEDENLQNKEEIDEVIHEYDILNNIGIKATNYSLLLSVLIKTIILAIFTI